MNTAPELEAEFQPQVSSPARGNRFEGGAQGGADPEEHPAQATAMGGQIAKGGERLQGGQAPDADEVNISGSHPAQRGEQVGADPGEQSIQALQSEQAGPDEDEQPGIRQGSKDENPGEQTIVGSHDSGEQESAMVRGSKDGNAGEQLAQLPASSEDKDKAVVAGVESEQQGSSNEKTGEQSIGGSKNPGEQESTIVRGGRKTMEQSRSRRGSRAGKTGEQAAQVISLSAAHLQRPRQDGPSRPAKSTTDYAIPGGEVAVEQAPQWLKSILPEAANGWWDVYPKDGGFAVKFCWRDQERQMLTFSRISYEQFQALKQGDPDEVRKNLRAQIANHLDSFLSDPGKCDKALVVAEKLGIDLSIPTVPPLISKEL